RSPTATLRPAFHLDLPARSRSRSPMVGRGDGGAGAGAPARGGVAVVVPVVLVVVAERVGVGGRVPAQAGHSPALVADVALGGLAVPADEVVGVVVPVEVAHLVLEAAGEQAVPLDRDGLAVLVGAGHAGPPGAAAREVDAGDGQAALEVLLRIRHGLGDLGRLEHRVDHATATGDPSAAGLDVLAGEGVAVLGVEVGAVVDEEAFADAHLVGGQADTVRRVHGLVEVHHETAEFFRGLGDWFGGGVERGVAVDDDGQDGHGSRSQSEPGKVSHTGG